MKKILVITWFYPPVNSSEGLVTYKLLNNSRYEYDVFTQKNSASWSYGNNDNLENNRNIYKAEIVNKYGESQGTEYITETDIKKILISK